jgi:hypothetical protein
MIEFRPFDVRTSVAAVTLGAAFGCILLVTLFIITRPSAYGARLAAVERTADRIESLLRAPGDPASFHASALCHDTGARAADLYNATLQNAAASAGVTLASANIVPGTPDASGVSTVAVQFDATGPYSGALGLMGRLAAADPELFLETVDLKSQVSSVELRLQGRFYCQDLLH